MPTAGRPHDYPSPQRSSDTPCPILERGSKWELETGDDASMIGDTEGFLAIEELPEDPEPEDDEDGDEAVIQCDGCGEMTYESALIDGLCPDCRQEFDDRGGRLMAVYGYPRASTKKQVDSPETQMDNIRKYADLHGLGEVTFFVDAAKTGKVPWQDREAGRELFAQLKPGDHVIIAKLDRAFRRLSDCVVVLEQFERMGIKLHVVNLLGGAIDLSSPMGRFLIHILAAFAELERAFISERTQGRAGQQEATGSRLHQLSWLRHALGKEAHPGQVAEGQSERRRRT